MSYLVYAILITLVLAHTFIAATASFAVLRDRSLDRYQVAFKLIASWAVPYGGPLFILYIMNDHSPELIPEYVNKGLLHIIFFRPINPAPHRENPIGNEGGYCQNSDASDIGFGGEGSCGGGGD